MDFEEKTLKRESKFKGHIFEVAVDAVSYTHLTLPTKLEV